MIVEMGGAKVHPSEQGLADMFRDGASNIATRKCVLAAKLRGWALKRANRIAPLCLMVETSTDVSYLLYAHTFVSAPHAAADSVSNRCSNFCRVDAKELEARELTAEEQAIITARVTHQQRMFAAFQKQDLARKVLHDKLHAECTTAHLNVLTGCPSRNVQCC